MFVGFFNPGLYLVEIATACLQLHMCVLHAHSQALSLGLFTALDIPVKQKPIKE